MAQMIRYKGVLYQRIDSPLTLGEKLREKAASKAIEFAAKRAYNFAEKEGIKLKITKTLKESRTKLIDEIKNSLDIKVSVEYLNYDKHHEEYDKGVRESVLTYDKGKGFGDIANQLKKDILDSLRSQGFAPQAFSMLGVNGRIFHIAGYIE